MNNRRGGEEKAREKLIELSQNKHLGMEANGEGATTKATKCLYSFFNSFVMQAIKRNWIFGNGKDLKLLAEWTIWSEEPHLDSVNFIKFFRIFVENNFSFDNQIYFWNQKMKFRQKRQVAPLQRLHLL